MTTGWSAAPGTDPAPRIAYELAAAVADGDEAMTEKIWADLGAAVRARVLAALGAQARHAAGAAAGVTGAVFGPEQARDVRARLRDCQGRDAALRALDGQPARRLPSCDGCPLPAVALARARFLVMAAFGFSAAQCAEICRRAARR